MRRVISFLHQNPPHVSSGSGGPRVVAICHWVGELWLSVTGKEGSVGKLPAR